MDSVDRNDLRPDPADSSRLARYAAALAFVEGHQWHERPRRGEARLTVNYARTLIRKVASYVFPAPVTFSVPELQPVPTPESTENEPILAANTPERRAELALATVIAELDLARMDLELAIESAILGDAAMKITWDPTTNQGRGGPNVAAVDPATLRAWWAPDNPRRTRRIVQRYGLPGAAVSELIAEWSQNGPVARVDRLGLDRDRLYPVVEDWTESHWRVSVADHTVRSGPNPYGWIPYVIIPNNPRPHAFWGESDLDDLYDLCRELNRRLSVVARILDLSGAPIAVLENVDGSEGITVGPGAKWELPEGAKAYLLDLLGGGGVSLHLDYIQLLYRGLHDLSETPRTAFGDAGRNLSGVALEVEIQPLVQQVNRKRRGWDAAFRQRNARLLSALERFGGHDFAGHHRTETIWPPVLPGDQVTNARTQAQLVAAGIRSRRTAITELGGNDPDGELARIRHEALSHKRSATSRQH